MRIANEPASESAPGTHRSLERPLFEPPRVRRPDEGERPTSWLEFFFDLVFVVAVDQVARRLQHEVTAHHAIVHVAYAEAGAGKTAWRIVVRKLVTIAAALLLGALGGALSAVEVTAILAAASGVQVSWSIWDRARTDPLIAATAA